jgi:putative SOS response-associated peptidase YedK
MTAQLDPVIEKIIPLLPLRDPATMTPQKPISGPHLVYGFLTTSPNATVEPIHPKAMPVILTTDEERDVWMRAVGRGESIAAPPARY